MPGSLYQRGTRLRAEVVFVSSWPCPTDCASPAPRSAAERRQVEAHVSREASVEKLREYLETNHALDKREASIGVYSQAAHRGFDANGPTRAPSR